MIELEKEMTGIQRTGGEVQVYKTEERGHKGGDVLLLEKQRSDVRFGKYPTPHS